VLNLHKVFLDRRWGLVCTKDRVKTLEGGLSPNDESSKMTSRG
jgi:hypothetical protein